MADTNVSRSGSWRANAVALKNQFDAENVLIYSGHAFKISQGLLSYVNTLVTLGVTEITILDDSSLPCLIANLKEFLDLLLLKHIEATNTLAMAWSARKNDL